MIRIQQEMDVIEVVEKILVTFYAGVPAEKSEEKRLFIQIRDTAYESSSFREELEFALTDRFRDIPTIEVLHGLFLDAFSPRIEMHLAVLMPLHELLAGEGWVTKFDPESEEVGGAK